MSLTSQARSDVAPLTATSRCIHARSRRTPSIDHQGREQPCPKIRHTRIPCDRRHRQRSSGFEELREPAVVIRQFLAVWAAQNSDVGDGVREQAFHRNARFLAERSNERPICSRDGVKSPCSWQFRQAVRRSDNDAAHHHIEARNHEAATTVTDPDRTSPDVVGGGRTARCAQGRPLFLNASIIVSMIQLGGCASDPRAWKSGSASLVTASLCPASRGEPSRPGKNLTHYHDFWAVSG